MWIIVLLVVFVVVGLTRPRGGARERVVTVGATVVVVGLEAVTKHLL